MKNKGVSVMGAVFLTVFLDIVGFSVLFPLFPAILDHYLQLEGPNSMIGQLATGLKSLAGSGDAPDFAVVTLFGGILGSVYGLLQFLFATVWGGLSDRVGRRPVLLMTLLGTISAGFLWVYAGTFATLVAARVLGGIMAGNISSASAAIADSTPPGERAKGMGIVGMAIGLGFILGPALGGLSMSIPFEAPPQDGSFFALNAFSMPALVSTLLAILNFLLVWQRFPETLPAEKRHTASSWNPFSRLRGLKSPGLGRVNILYLIFLIAFAGVEFTLTFLASERLGYSHTDLAWMFVFVGFVIAFVQGGIVRRVSPKYGERAVARTGILLVAPGFLLIGSADSASTLYGGLTLMAIGSALVMPCLSALVSRYAPAKDQGLALGSFRSMGSLSRAIGPVIGAVLYWKLGSSAPYIAGAAALSIPFLLSLKLPEPKDS